jgi:hypothetical protein
MSNQPELHKEEALLVEHWRRMGKLGTFCAICRLECGMLFFNIGWRLMKPHVSPSTDVALCEAADYIGVDFGRMMKGTED